MIHIDFNALNPLEQKIHATCSEHSKTVGNIRITKAAELCDCSVSKISKFVKKLGFRNYKQYLDFLYGRELPKAKQSSELTRVEEFIRDFDQKKVDEMVELISAYDKLVLFGYGPSLLCAQYLEYRLRTFSNKATISAPDALSLAAMVDKNTLLLIFTVTGTFRSFEQVYKSTKQKGGTVAIIAEEYNPSLFEQADKIIYLAKEAQPSHFYAYEKNRTIFFIFMEEVIRRLAAQQKTPAESAELTSH